MSPVYYLSADRLPIRYTSRLVKARRGRAASLDGEDANSGTATDSMPQAAERPIEGRERELDLLLDRWQRAREGAGQVVLMSGAAGVGKTRLVEELGARTAGEDRAFLVCRCSRFRRFTAFSPLVDLLRRLELERDRRRAKETSETGPPVDLDSAATETEDRLRDTVIARLTALLAPPRRHRKTALNLHPEGRPKKTLEEILGLFVEVARRLPVLLVVDDLDWADPSTLELLALLVHRRPRARWLTVLTFSSNYEPPWGHRAHVAHVELSRLSPRQQETVLDRLADRRIEADLRREIIARADGLPLVLEELVRLAPPDAVTSPAEAELAGSPAAAEPPVLANVSTVLKPWLSARLARLGQAREVVELAAVLGEEHSRAQLKACSTLDEAELEEALERLVAAGILVRPGAGGDFAFRHPLIKEAVYSALLEERRRQMHARVAEILERSFPEAASREPELMAHHWGEAGLPAAAAAAWHRAAEQAVRSSANLEAAERARRGLEVLDSAAGGAARSSLEIALNIALGAAMGTAKGFAAAEAEDAYGEALDLAWQTPPSADQFQALMELNSYYLSRGQVRVASEVAERALEAIGDSASESLCEGQRALGFSQLLQGDFAGAEANLEKSLAPYAVHRSLLPATPPALGIPLAETLSHLALAQWFLGHPSRALKHSTDSLTLARRFNDPYSRVFTIYRASFFHVFRREPVATRELAHELVGLANRHGFLFFIAAGMFLEGQALAAQGRAAEGMIPTDPTLIQSHGLLPPHHLQLASSDNSD